MDTSATLAATEHSPNVTFEEGMTLDWQDSLMQSGFVFENPHAKKSCGCGTSFTA